MIIDDVSDEGSVGRTYADAPEIDGQVHLKGESELIPGTMVMAHIDDSDAYDLHGHVVADDEDDDGWDW